jgi:hypothetical protein
MTPEELERQTETLALINSEIVGRLDRQTDCLNRIDTKAVLVVGYAIAAVSFLATRHAQPLLAGLAYAAFAVAAGCGIATLALRNYPDIGCRRLVTGYAGGSRAVILAALVANRVEDFEYKKSRLKAKARGWWISLAALLTGTILMVTAILVQTGQHDHRQSVGQPAASVVRLGSGAY